MISSSHCSHGSIDHRQAMVGFLTRPCIRWSQGTCNALRHCIAVLQQLNADQHLEEIIIVRRAHRRRCLSQSRAAGCVVLLVVG